jgi:hypothetical protein
MLLIKKALEYLCGFVSIVHGIFTTKAVYVGMAQYGHQKTANLFLEFIK